MYFYREPAPDTRGMLQGDILSPVPFVKFLVTQAAVKLPGSPEIVPMNLTQVDALEPKSSLLANVNLSTGIVLNQSCDLTGNSNTPKPLLVARIRPASEIQGFTTEKTKNRVKAINRLLNPKKAPSLFYLPEYKGAGFALPRSVVHLLDIACFASNDIPALSEACLRLRLTDPALKAFQERLTHCFGRFAEPDHLFLSVDEARCQSK